MVASRIVVKTAGAAASRLDTQMSEKKGSGQGAREWIYGLALPRTERAIALEFAYFVNRDGLAWPSRYTIAARAGCSVRTVQTAIENLIARGVLIEAGMKAVRDPGGAKVRTRLYRLPVGEDPVRVMPKAEARRLTRQIDGAMTGIESAKAALSPAAGGNRSKVQNLHFRSAENGEALDPSKVQSLHFRGRSKVQKLHTNPRSNLERFDGAAVGAPPTPADAPPAKDATNVKPVAAREPVYCDGFTAELTAAEVAATVERRRRALSTTAGRWWDLLPTPLRSAADRPNRLGGDRKDWRRGAKA